MKPAIGRLRTEPGPLRLAPKAGRKKVAEEGAPPTTSPETMLNYWHSLRRGRAFASYDDLDLRLVGESWPNCMMLVADRHTGDLEPDAIFAQTFRMYRRDEEFGSGPRVDLTPMVVEWILSLGRACAALGKPVVDTETFANNNKPVQYRVTALPLSGDQIAIDRIICQAAIV